MKVIEAASFLMMFLGAGSVDSCGLLGGLVALVGALILLACANKEELDKNRRRNRRRYS